MAASVDFFFYGTLRDADVRNLVMGSGVTPRVADGQLPGYRCAPAEGGRYPGVVQAPAAASAGVLVPDVGLDAAARLSFFEGDGYDYGVALCRIEVVGGPRDAWVYLPTSRLALGAGAWDIGRWRRRHKAAFLADARAAMAGYTPHLAAKHWEFWEERLAG